MDLEEGRVATAGRVVSVSRSDAYSFTKPVCDEIVLVAGFGVEGDVHGGTRVRHRSRVRADPTQPNLRQVHLIPAEVFREVQAKGYEVLPGHLGENVTTAGVDLLGLSLGTILRFGPPRTADPERRGDASQAAVAGVLATAASTAVDGPTAKAVTALRAAAAREPGSDPRPALIVTGLRNPCGQINGLRPGLLKEVIGRGRNGEVIRKAGIMAVVLRGGTVRPGDPVIVEPPPHPHEPLERV